MTKREILDLLAYTEDNEVVELQGLSGTPWTVEQVKQVEKNDVMKTVIVLK